MDSINSINVTLNLDSSKYKNINVDNIKIEKFRDKLLNKDIQMIEIYLLYK